MDEIRDKYPCTLEDGGGADDGKGRDSAFQSRSELSHGSSRKDEKVEKRKAWLKNLLTPP